MANEEHLNLLKQGAETWNQWREENPNIDPDLTGANLKIEKLSSAHLTSVPLYRTDRSSVVLSHLDHVGVDLSRANLAGANLSEAYLREADLRGANLTRVDFERADLGGANLTGAILTLTDLFQAILIGADLSETCLVTAELRGANLTGANLSKVDLHGANLAGANLSEANLREADLRGANLTSVDFEKADLREVDLRRTILNLTNLNGANLTGADLTQASFYTANLRKANLTRANLHEAKLNEVDLFQANLSQADFSQAQVNWTIFGDINLSDVQGLDTVRHSGPSTIGIDTIYRSAGKIPEAFLRGCGLSNWEIEATKLYNPNLTSVQLNDVLYKIHELRGDNPIQYYSCFISYSSKDQVFAERLYADLQKKDVRCWFAPEDLKFGAKIRVGIDESIRVHDKLLLVLSKHSVRSQWVEQEVETALARERNQDETVLFPIRLDNAVMKMEGGWPALIKNTRTIGDFRQWKKHDVYQKTFERLLRDLKASE